MYISELLILSQEPLSNELSGSCGPGGEVVHGIHHKSIDVRCQSSTRVEDCEVVYKDCAYIYA